MLEQRLDILSAVHVDEHHADDSWYASSCISKNDHRWLGEDLAALGHRPCLVVGDVVVAAAVVRVLVGVADTDADAFSAIAPLVWIVVLCGVIALYRRQLRRTRRRGGSAPRRCQAHHNKREFATHADAERFVEWTRGRHAAGRWTGAPMDHSYKCPTSSCDHWHVSSKARRGW